MVTSLFKSLLTLIVSFHFICYYGTSSHIGICINGTTNTFSKQVKSMFASFSGVDALQCYNCRGITHYDQNQCFEPNKQKTVIQECWPGQVCEVGVLLGNAMKVLVSISFLFNSN